ncbi:hypothetical protein [Noviherbaspirillum aerium]|uniref:hypothetical protein n=1 Tax=Noviherbaspirillum aerium TaxID=2588497 RepID=UPI001CEF8640|nr:hypothetical protein [Noviherbaspirillum aerium]
MKTSLLFLTAISALWATAAPAHAGGNVQWSVSVGNGVPVYSPPPVVVYEQPQFIYGPPPSGFPDRPVYYQYQPPPPVHYVVPGPVYQSPQPHYHQHQGYGHGRGYGQGYSQGRGHGHGQGHSSLRR